MRLISVASAKSAAKKTRIVKVGAMEILSLGKVNARGRGATAAQSAANCPLQIRIAKTGAMEILSLGKVNARGWGAATAQIAKKGILEEFFEIPLFFLCDDTI